MSLSRIAQTVKRVNPENYRPTVPIELYPILFFATVLRVFRLETESYWLDEAFSVNLVTSETLAELLFEMPGNEPHPPLYNVLLHGWTAIFGRSELATRSLSALLGIVTVIALYGIGVRLFDRRVGAVAAVLVAVSPFHIWYSQETRMYSLLALVIALSFYFFVRLHNNPPAEKTVIRPDIGYVFSTVLLGYTHVFGLFAILAQNVYVFSRPVVKGVPSSDLTFRRWIALESLTAILLLPWGIQLSRRVVAAHGGDAGNVSWIPTPTAETIRQTFAAYLGGYLFEESLPILVTLLIAGCIALALSNNSLAAESTERDLRLNGTYLLVLWLMMLILVPVLLSYAVEPIYVTRYAIGAALAFFLLVAKGVQMLSYSSLQYLVVGLLIISLVLPLPTYYGTDQKEQWREAAAQVESNVDTGDVILVSRPWTTTPFNYYFDHSEAAVIPLNVEASSNEIHDSLEEYNDVWVVLSYTDDSTEQRILEAVANHPEYRGPVEAEGYIGVVVYRFERV